MYINEFEEVRKERKGKQVNQQKKKGYKEKRKKEKKSCMCLCVSMCKSHVYFIFIGP